MRNAIFLFVVIATGAAAGWAPTGTVVPEINAATIPTAIALLGGGILVVQAYLKK